MRTTGMALASSSGSPIVKMLAKMLEVLLCSASSSAMASGTWVTRAIAVTAASSSHVSRFDRTIMPTSSSHASAKYAARIQAASSNVDCDGLSTKTTSAIGGTATSEMKSSTGHLSRAGFRTHSPKGNNDPIDVPPGQIPANRLPAHRRDYRRRYARWPAASATRERLLADRKLKSAGEGGCFLLLFATGR